MSKRAQREEDSWEALRTYDGAWGDDTGELHRLVVEAEADGTLADFEDIAATGGTFVREQVLWPPVLAGPIEVEVIPAVSHAVQRTQRERFFDDEFDDDRWGQGWE